jgi:hypothetical protein
MDNTWDGIERRDIIGRRRVRIERFADRRGGFDRRRRYPILGAALDNPVLVAVGLVLLNVLSLIDGFYTAVEVGSGVAYEANPILAAAAGQSPFLAVLLKVGMIGTASALIWLNRRRRAVLIVALAGLVLYAGIVLYHRYALGVLGLL